MKLDPWILGVLILLGSFAAAAAAPGPDDEAARAKLQGLRQRLARLKAGMSAEQVLQALGKPDEVRRVTDDRLLDGTRLLGDQQGIGPETERWAYGILGKGAFARIGFVSLDRNGKVVAVVPADCFSSPSWPLPALVPAPTDQAVDSAAKLRCHVAAIQPRPRAGETAASLQTKITLQNRGTRRFELKHDAAYTLRRFLVVEVYDAAGTLLFRDDEMRSHSLSDPDPARWPVLAIPAQQELAADLVFSPAHGFGPLPPGKYSMRVYFPFETGKYYPSNRVPFELKAEPPRPPNGD
jgi:hypothetical protein